MEERQLTFKFVYNQKTASQENKETFLQYCNFYKVLLFLCLWGRIPAVSVFFEDPVQ